MGLHDDQGKRKKGVLMLYGAENALKSWITIDPRFLLEYDKVQNGIEKAWGSKHYVLST